MTDIVDNPEWLLLLLAPVFIAMMALEYAFGQRAGRLPKSGHYSLTELMCNFSLAGLHQLSDLLAGLLISYLYLSVFGWRLFDIEMSLSTFLLLMILQDFSIIGSIERVIEFVGCGRHMLFIIARRA